MLVRASRHAALAGALAAAGREQPTYEEVGATLRDELPEGYHHLRLAVAVGRGHDDFAAAIACLRSWRAHQRRWLRVAPGTEPREGASVLVLAGPSVLALAAPCRIVGVHAGEERYAVAYGTLPGHPERGEECFEVRLDAEGAVTFEVRAFSVAASVLARAAGALGRLAQRRVARGFGRSLQRCVVGARGAGG